MKDAQIIELFWCRSTEAIFHIKAKYENYCFSISRNILGNQEDAEECVNDTWMQAWNTIPPHRPQVLRLFLARLTRSISFNRYKAKTAQKRGGGEIETVLEELEECLSSPGDAADEVIAKELGESIRQFVRELPEREGNIFVRRYFFTDPVQEIAKRYSLTPNNTTVILSRTRKKLKERLIREGYIHE